MHITMTGADAATLSATDHPLDIKKVDFHSSIARAGDAVVRPIPTAIAREPYTRVYVYSPSCSYSLLP